MKDFIKAMYYVSSMRFTRNYSDYINKLDTYIEPY